MRTQFELPSASSNANKESSNISISAVDAIHRPPDRPNIDSHDDVTTSYITNNNNSSKSTETPNRSSAIVYIAGRVSAKKTKAKKERGDEDIIEQLHLSVRSVCHATTISSSSSITPSMLMLNFVFFVSETDYDVCTTNATHSDQCDYSIIENSCRDELPGATFNYVALDNKILSLWKEHTGIVSFGHHSTWYGYTKLWLPILLNDYSNILFVDTDTIWNHPPSLIFDELRHFNSSQVIGATSIVNRPKHNQSKSFPNRVTSGVLLIDLEKIRQTLNWVGILKESIVSNRGGIGVGEAIPDNYNRSTYCDDFHWGKFSQPLCLSVPELDSKYEGCDTSLRTCWHATEGDQEFLSNIVSFFHPELLYELPEEHQCIKMGQILGGDIGRCKNSTLIHAPQIGRVWSEKKDNILNDEELANALPPAVYESVHWFRVHIKNMTIKAAASEEINNSTNTKQD